jgi:hypothetical protein
MIGTANVVIAVVVAAGGTGDGSTAFIASGAYNIGADDHHTRIV